MKQIGAIVHVSKNSDKEKKCKALLPLEESCFGVSEEKCVLEYMLAGLQQAGLQQICVASDFEFEKISSYVGHFWGAFAVHGKNFQDSFDLAAVAMQEKCSAVLVISVDTPLIRKATFSLVMQAWQENPQKIVVPFFGKKAGQLFCLPLSLADKISDWDGKIGDFCEKNKDLLISQQVPDEYMLLNLETQSDYELILQKVKDFEIPTRNECLALLQRVAKVPEKIVRHSVLVADLAREMGKSLHRYLGGFDLAVLEAAGLLHDIARLEANHGPQGAKYLHSLGFEKVAKIIAPHSDMNAANQPYTYQEIIFLADKYYKENQAVTLEERYGEKMKKYGKDSESIAHVQNRLANAKHSEARFQEITGENLYALACKVAKK